MSTRCDKALEYVSKFLRDESANRIVEYNTCFDLFMCVSKELFNDIETIPLQLRACLGKMMNARYDIIFTILSLTAKISQQLIDVDENLANTNNGRKQLVGELVECITNRGSVETKHISVCIYAIAIYFNIDIYVLSKNRNVGWGHFPPLFPNPVEMDEQFKTGATYGPNRIKYITMYMEESDLGTTHFYKVKSTEPDARKPVDIGLIGYLAGLLKGTPARELGVPSEMVGKLGDPACLKNLSENIGERTVKSYCELLCSDDKGDLCDGIIMHRGPNRDKLEEHLLSNPDLHKLLCKVLVKELDMAALKELGYPDETIQIPLYLKQYEALRRLETRQMEIVHLTASYRSVPEELDGRRGDVNKAVVATSSTGIVGGILTIVGLALAPVTFGASLGLTIAGAAIGIGSGSVQAGFRINESLKQNGTLNGLKENDKLMREVEGAILQKIEEIDSLFQTGDLDGNGIRSRSPGISIKGFLSIGSVLRTFHGIPGVALTAIRVSATATTAVSAVLGPISLALDIGFLAEAAHGLYGRNKTNASKLIECILVSEDLRNVVLRGNVDTNTRKVDQIVGRK